MILPRLAKARQLTAAFGLMGDRAALCLGLRCPRSYLDMTGTDDLRFGRAFVSAGAMFVNGALPRKSESACLVRADGAPRKSDAPSGQVRFFLLAFGRCLTGRTNSVSPCQEPDADRRVLTP